MKRYLICIYCLFLILNLSCMRMRGSKIRVGISVADMNNPEFLLIKKGMESVPDSIKKVTEVIFVSADTNIEKQTEQVTKLINDDGIDILLLNCVSEYRSGQMMKIIEKEDIPIISLINIPLTGQAYGYVTPNYFLTGKFQSQYVIDKLDGKGKVMILSGDTFSEVNATITQQNRIVLDKFFNISIVFQKFYNNNSSIKSDVDSILSLYHNDIKAIIANTDEIVLSALEVLKSKNLEKKIISVGAGCSLDAVRSILRDELTMSIDMGYEELGSLAFLAAVDMINLRPLNDNGLKYKNGDFKVPWILSPVRAYDKTNILQLINNQHKYTKEQISLSEEGIK
jgi:ABC-type sugar transport system substrate-binding protein